MSINWVMMSPDGHTPVPLPQEKTFVIQNKVKLVLDCNTDEGYPGTSGGYWEINHGTVQLSNQRIIYLSDSPDTEIKSLNIPLLHFKQWKLEQPWFGANYVTGIVLPIQGGGLSRQGKVKLTFTEGGAIEFTHVLRELLERLSECNEIPVEYERLPTYQPGDSNSGPSDLPPKYEE
ncbi:hypothetical protein BDB01DRAFT_853275 [Pilobolus umbonatus]|nr:hypothetical protein BDB01DRAFT_853275 [Pilobolus umbonatus]